MAADIDAIPHGDQIVELVPVLRECPRLAQDVVGAGFAERCVLIQLRRAYGLVVCLAERALRTDLPTATGAGGRVQEHRHRHGDVDSAQPAITGRPNGNVLVRLGQAFQHSSAMIGHSYQNPEIGK